MKLRTTVGALLEAYQTVSPTLDRKGASANLYLNANEKLCFLYLYSTNLLTETATKIKLAPEDLEAPGEVLVNPSKLSDGLTGLPKDTPVTLSLTPTGNALKVQAGNVKFSLAANIGVKEIADRLKSIPSRTTEAVAIMPANELIEFTKRSVFCIPNDQTGQRANLAALKLSTGLDIEEAFATDGSIAVHIASAKKQGKGEGLGATGLLIPAQALQPLSTLVSKRKGEDVSIIRVEKGNKVFFRFADGTHFGALFMASAYPNLTSIINQKAEFIFDLPRELFKQSLARATSFVPSVTTKRILELELGPESIKLIANGDDSLSDSVAITYNGPKPTNPIRLGMNIDMLFNVTTSSHSENLTFGFTSAEKPLIVTDKEGEDDELINIKYVVSGVRLAH